MRSFFILFFLISSFHLSLFAQTENDKKKISALYDTYFFSALETKFHKEYLLQKSKIDSYFEQNKHQLIKSTDSSFIEIERISENGIPIYFQSHNANAAIATRVNFLQDNGGLDLNLSGNNMVAYVWDSGHPRVTHDEFKDMNNISRVSLEDVVAEGGGNYTQFHATHVTGTLIGSGKAQKEAKGMAYNAESKNYKWTDHFSEVTNVAANGALLSNHSYGWYNNGLPSYEFGSYSSMAADWDMIMYNAPYFLMVFSAGNDGQASYNTQPILTGFDKISGHQCAKNNLVVTNATSIVLDELGNFISASINSSSSIGPMDELRIKPEIAGKGTDVLSAYSTNDYSCASLTGTSMAAPNVSGSLLLVQQHNKNSTGNYLKAATLKGLALHTADDILPFGPDAFSGWGLLNAKKMVQTISSNGSKSSIQELTLLQGQTYTFSVQSDDINTLMASISWTDLPGNPNSTLNSNQSKLINDLDIRITKNGSTFFPYKLISANSFGYGDNQVDPFEKIAVENPNGNYLISVSHKGTLTTDQQNFSLIITGIFQNCNVQIATDLTFTSITSNSVVVKWKNSADNFYRIRYRILGNPTWTTILTSEKEYKITGLMSFTNYEFQLESYCNMNNSGFSSSSYFSTTGSYCSSSGGYYRNIRLFEINTFVNNTLINNTGYYSFFDTPIKIVKGQSNNLKITTGNYSYGSTIWIDFNQNGSFTDVGEMVFSSANDINNPIVGNFTIPTNIANCVTRMRVSIKQNGVATSCDTGFNGQVQDYLVKITDIQCSSTTTWNGINWSNGFPTSNFQVLFSGDYTGNGFECCSLTINSNVNVVIEENQNLTVEGDLSIPSNASLLLKNNANLIQLNNNPNTGNVRILRKTSPLKRLDYVLWSSPVDNQNLNDFSPNTLSNRFYQYNSTTNLYQNINPLVTNFGVANSFLIRLPNNHPQFPTEWTGEFFGIPNNGNYTINVPTNKYIAIGNPYPSSFDLFNFAVENTIQSPFYFWRKENNANSSSYATYTLFLGGISNSGDPNEIEPSRNIRIGQGFFIYNQFPTVRFKNYMRTKNSSSPFLRNSAVSFQNRLESIETHKIVLTLEGENAISSNMVFAYIDGGTDEVDDFIDGKYINDSQNALTSLINEEEFTIQGKGLPFDMNDQIPLCFKTNNSGNFTISMIKGTGVFNEAQTVYLLDNFNMMIHNLSQSSYSFYTDSGIFKERFKIVFLENALNTNQIKPNLNSFIVKNKTLFIELKNQTIQDLYIYDLCGRLIYKKQNFNKKSIEIDLHTISQSVYLVKIKTTDGKLITEKIINRE